MAKTTTAISSSDYAHTLLRVSDDVELATCVHIKSTSAPWIVLINSLATNLTLWDAVLPSFTAHFNVVTYDQRGHGLSSVQERDFDLDALADDVARLLDMHGVQVVHAVVGVSQGGATTLDFAVRYGVLRTRRIVVCGIHAVCPAPLVAVWEQRKAVARSSAQGMTALADVTVPRWFAPGKSKATDSVRATAHRMICATPPEGYAKGATVLQGYDLYARGLVEVLKGGPDGAPPALPTLLVAGSADDSTILTAMHDTEERVGQPSTKLVIIDGAGHLPMLDCPQQFVDAVVPWLLADSGGV